MFHRAPDPDITAISSSIDAALERLTPCDPAALYRLTSAYAEGGPAAILVGDGRARSSQVIDSFLERVDESTSVSRISAPISDATSCMRAVVRSMGFEPKDFCLEDLEKIFTMFLSHQKTHGRRTVICIEDAQACDPWVLNKCAELVAMEADERMGLFVILSGRQQIKELLHQHPLQDLAMHAGRYISVSPLALAETRELILKQIASEGTQDVSEIIDFDAITAIHEIGAGIPDTVSGICTKSMELAAEESAFPITENAISRAACSLGLAANADDDLHIEDFEDSADETGDASGWLSVRLGENVAVNRAIKSDCVSIGRDATNDLCIPSLLVSRHHVLIVTSTKGVEIIDVGSTNGTFVNDQRVRSQLLSSGDNIRLGDCRITYALTN